MPYLILSDYLRSIQPAQMTQVTGGNDLVRQAAEITAQSEITEHLTQKYDMTGIFTNTTLYDITKVYQAADRVYTTNSGVDTLYYAVYPEPLFNVYGSYAVGDMVYWKGKTYRCLVASRNNSASIQYVEYQNIPLNNVFPDAIGATSYWQVVNANYTVPVNTPLNNATYWTLGDNRNPSLVRVMIDIALYYLHMRIAPNNIPPLRMKNYQGEVNEVAVKNGRTTFPVYSAIGWLQAAAEGDITADLPIIHPKQGTRIRFGGPIKNDNTY